MAELDLDEASRLITGTVLKPERQTKLYKLAHALAIRTDDPVFAVLVALEGYEQSFSHMPDRLAEAARSAALDVEMTAQTQAKVVIAETVASIVDHEVLTGRLRSWVYRACAALTISIVVAVGVAALLIGRLSVEAQVRINDVATAAQSRVDVIKASLTDAAVASATQAAATVGQKVADATVAGLQSRLDMQVNAEAVAALKFGQSHADEVRDLLNAEASAPGTLQRLKQLSSQGWLSVVKANPSGPCRARSRDDSGRVTCILWAPD